MTHRSFLSVLATCFLAASAWADGTPKLHFDRTVYDFGKTNMVPIVTGTFTFQNTGDGVLVMGKPVPGCGCTIASLSTNTLNPGEKGELVFSLKIGTVGHRLDKFIQIPSNDPQTPTVALTVSVEPVKTFEATPPNIIFGDLHIGSTTNITLQVKRPDGKPVNILVAQCSSSNMTAVVEPVAGNPALADLKVSITGDGAPRQALDQIQLIAADTGGPGAVITVSGRVVGDVKVDPIALVWQVSVGTNSPAEHNRSRSLNISATQTKFPLKPSHVICSLKALKVQIDPLKDSDAYELVVTIPDDLHESLAGMITFETGVPTMPRMMVPVQITVRK